MPRVCSVNGCARARRCKGYCGMHYSRVRNAGTPGSAASLVQGRSGLCTVDGCFKTIRSRRLCESHYSMFLTRGTTEAWRPKVDCDVAGCARKHYAKGLCSLHWGRMNRTGSTDAPTPRKKVTCAVECCEAVALARGICSLHYSRWRSHGSTELPERKSVAVPASERFTLHFNEGEPHECWEWLGTRSVQGYGVIGEMFAGSLRQLKAHRLSYEHYVGPIPEGFGIDHQCRNPACVNPHHLLPANPKLNGENRVSNVGTRSKYRGVTFRKARNKWVAYVGHNGETFYLGMFDTEDEAGRAAIDMRNRLFTNNVPDRPGAINPYVRL